MTSIRLVELPLCGLPTLKSLSGNPFEIVVHVQVLTFVGNEGAWLISSTAAGWLRMRISLKLPNACI